MIDPYLDFLSGLGFGGFLRVFWFFFLFEFPRYILLDYVVLIVHGINKRMNRGAYAEARRNLFIETPLVSLIIPGKNEGENFHQLAFTLKEQTYQNYELIVIDDGSDDDSFLIGQDLEERGMIDLFLRNEVRGGKASAANFGLRYASGKYVLHFDADCSLDRDAIEKALIPFYLDDRVGAVGGNLGVRNTWTNLCTILQSLEYYIAITIGRLVSSSLGILRIVSGAFGAFRRDVLVQVGGWDIGPGLDGDLTVKIRKAGYRVFFEPSATTLTDVPTSFGTLAKQRLRWQRSLIRFRLRKHVNVFFPDENFSFANFFSFVENIFYNLILNILWYIYIYDILTNFTHRIGFIIITNFLLYTASKYVELIAILLFTDKKRSKLPLIPYVPLMVLYTGYYLRFVRTAAYFTEFFFKSSYKDSWNPAKTSRKAQEHGL